MAKSSSHNHEKAIQKALDDLFKGKYLIIKAAAYAYAILLFILTYCCYEHQNQALNHVTY